MLAIRMQRLGRKGHPTYRVVVQDSRQTPTSGKYVALLGSYDPHAKSTTLVKEKAQFYLDHGAQPSDRVVRLFQAEGVKLPSWVKTEVSEKTRSIRNPEKLRKNRPAEETVEAAEVNEAPEAAEVPEVEVASADVSSEASAKEEEPVTEVAEAAEETPAEAAEAEQVAEVPAEEAAPEASKEAAEDEPKEA